MGRRGSWRKPGDPGLCQHRRHCGRHPNGLVPGQRGPAGSEAGVCAHSIRLSLGPQASLEVLLETQEKGASGEGQGNGWEHRQGGVRPLYSEEPSDSWCRQGADSPEIR